MRRQSGLGKFLTFQIFVSLFSVFFPDFGLRKGVGFSGLAELIRHLGHAVRPPQHLLVSGVAFQPRSSLDVVGVVNFMPLLSLVYQLGPERKGKTKPC